jgi:uncharacterized protein YcbK (DUF882 family)
MRRSLTALLALLVGLAAPAVGAAQQRRRSASRARISLSSYRAINQRWHNPSAVPAARFTSDGRFVLRLRSLNGLGSAEVTPERQDGGFDEAQRAEVARVLGDRRTGTHAPIDRRLIDVIFQIARHFEVGQVNVVSGFRRDSRRSNHSLGRAADIVLPGVSDEAVAAYARDIGFLGVGVYPVSGFVHVDVRTRSYYWVDRSGPGRTASRSRRSRRRRRGGGMHEVHGDQAHEADLRARALGVTPLGGTEEPEAAEADDDADDDADDEQPRSPRVAPSGG